MQRLLAHGLSKYPVARNLQKQFDPPNLSGIVNTYD